METAEWERHVEDFWRTADDDQAGDTMAGMRALVAERPAGDPAALMEWAGVHDFLGMEAEAVPVYRDAIAAGLDPERHARAVVQLASSLRNIGSAAEAVDLLNQSVDHPAVGQARAAFLALAMFDAGRPGEGLRIALQALAPTLPAYQRAVLQYADELPVDV